MELNKEVSDYIMKSSQEQVLILESLRDIIHKAIPESKEDVKWGIPVFIKTKIFTYLRTTKNHISIGFYNLDKIDDSNGLLEGSGKTMKHLKIKHIKDINRELIINWLRASAE